MVILFTLYLKLILRLLGGRKYKYADDIIVLNVKYSLEKTACATTKDNTNVKVLKIQLNISFNKEKTEVIHFTRANNPNLPLVTLSGKAVLKPKEKDLRYLRVRLDKKLTF